MKPILQKINFRELPASSIKKICTCKTTCTEGVTVTFLNDGTILCFNDARSFMYDMIKNLDEGGHTVWTKNDEQFLIDKYNKEGMYYGFNSDAGIILGKSQPQVKSKMRRLRGEGRIK